MAGIRAMITPYMLRSTDWRPWACGESDTINFPSISFTFYCFTLLFSSSAADDAHDSGLALTDIVEQRTMGRTGELA